MKSNLKKITTWLLGLLYHIFIWTVILTAWAIWIGFWFVWLAFPYIVLVYILVVPLFQIYRLISRIKFMKYIRQSVIIFGGRGKGKGVMFQFAINNEKAVLSSQDFGENCTIVSPHDYFESIAPNDFLSAIKNDWKPVDKHDEWEGKPYYLDDSVVYFPNTEDSYLKKNFKSMPLTVVTLRHLYNTYLVINAQDLDRTWKNLRELQLDGYIKARGVIGFGPIARYLPVIRRFAMVKYSYYDKYQSASEGLLPFSALGIVNESTKGLYTTSASAMKQQYLATNGVISYGLIMVKKKSLFYNTRFFSTVIFKQKPFWFRKEKIYQKMLAHVNMKTSKN